MARSEHGWADGEEQALSCTVQIKRLGDQWLKPSCHCSNLPHSAQPARCPLLCKVSNSLTSGNLGSQLYSNVWFPHRPRSGFLTDQGHGILHGGRTAGDVFVLVTLSMYIVMLLQPSRLLFQNQRDLKLNKLVLASVNKLSMGKII